MLKQLAGIIMTATVCSVALIGAAKAADGKCTLNAHKVSGTYGYAAQGVATADTDFVPIGPFAQAGTVTQVATTEDASTINGTWSVSLSQNDSKGYTPNVSFGGKFQVNKTSCSGDFFITTPVTITPPAFHVVFVADGRAVRTIALLPNLIISYSTATKL